MAQVVEHLPSKLKALSSNFSPAKKQVKKGKKKQVRILFNPTYPKCTHLKMSVVLKNS
jgi:hypothetical protein